MSRDRGRGAAGSPKRKTAGARLRALGERLLTPTGPAKRRLRVTVGLDYGTYATKIVIHAIEPETGLEHPRRALSLFAQPCYSSSMTITGRRVAFGTEDGPEGSHVLRSVKMQLREAVLTPGRPRTHRTGLELDALVWAYLVHVVQEIELQLDELYPQDQYERDLSWHLGVPATAEQLAVESAFHALLWRAVHRPHGLALSPRPDLASIRDGYAQAQRLAVSDPSQSDCAVWAEAAVAVNTLHLCGAQLQDGHYFLADIGAGTTDLAFFWYSQTSLEPINFYGTECVACAGDAFHDAIVAHLQARRPAKTKEHLRAIAQKGLHDQRVSPRDPALVGLLAKLRRSRATAFGRAREKETLDRWSEVTGFVVGGGAALPGVQDTLLAPLETGIGDGELPIIRRRRLELANVLDATEFHWVAAGLSLPVEAFVPYEPEGEVEAVTDHSDVDTRSDWQQIQDECDW